MMIDLLFFLSIWFGRPCPRPAAKKSRLHKSRDFFVYPDMSLCNSYCMFIPGSWIAYKIKALIASRYCLVSCPYKLPSFQFLLPLPGRLPTAGRLFVCMKYFPAVHVSFILSSYSKNCQRAVPKIPVVQNDLFPSSPSSPSCPAGFPRPGLFYACAISAYILLSSPTPV